MSESAVLFRNVSKYYKLYDSPRDRLKEALHPFGRKRHREFFALKDIDLEVPKGEILGIVGRNGSGKSTLLKIIAGVIPASSGRVTIRGKVSALLDLGVGMNPEFDGIQNIHFGGLMLGIPPDEMKRRIDDIVAFADIGDFIRQPLKTYSSGMRARLGFALAVHIDPEILVVDEVLAVGDELFKRKCYARMEAMLKSGCTVIYVTHSANTVNQLCTRALLLEDGRLLLDGAPRLVTMNYQKLLFASPTDRGAIRAGIAALQHDSALKESLSRIGDGETKAGAPDSEEAGAGAPAAQAYRIDNFTPKSTTALGKGLAEIGDLRLRTPDGRDVNVLVPRQEYLFSYRARFLADVGRVNFGMGIKTQKGVDVSWNIHPAVDQFLPKLLVAGEEFEVRWRFRCLLHAGSYFVDCSIRHLDGDKPDLLHKVRDAFAFKVQAARPRRGGGVSDIFLETTVQRA